MKQQYALVTGASEGIGYEFCRVLAAKGYNVCLVARTQEKLDLAASKLESDFGIQTHVITCDLSKAKAAQHLFEASQSAGLSIEVLINNAGLLFNGAFVDISLQAQENLLACNITALTSLCHLYANEMCQGGSGRILNVSSTAAWIAIPNQNVYAASKAYVLSFSQALANELRAANTGVTVTTICPSYTDTKMLSNPLQGKAIAIPSAMKLDANFVAEVGIKACLAGKVTCVPGLSNRLAMAVVQCLPRSWLSSIFGRWYRKESSV